MSIAELQMPGSVPETRQAARTSSQAKRGVLEFFCVSMKSTWAGNYHHLMELLE
jgi:hypothetical protein